MVRKRLRCGEMAEPGLMHLTRNQTYLYRYRGFESLSLRQLVCRFESPTFRRVEAANSAAFLAFLLDRGEWENITDSLLGVHPLIFLHIEMQPLGRGMARAGRSVSQKHRKVIGLGAGTLFGTRGRRFESSRHDHLESIICSDFRNLQKSQCRRFCSCEKPPRSISTASNRPILWVLFAIRHWP